MKLIIILLACAAAFGAAGCDSHDIGGAMVPVEYPFDILLPPVQTPVDYYAESGISLQTQTIVVRDSLVESTTPQFYAQFRSANGSEPPAGVKLNGNILTPLSAGSDTLRLTTVSGTSLYNDNVWSLADGGDSASFVIARVDGIDSVAPFVTRKSFRRDTSITMRWKPPTSGSSGMYITWTSSGKYTYAQRVDDNIGTFEIPRKEVEKLAGPGKIYITRYLTLQKTFKGKSVMLRRLVQRIYPVTIE